MTFMDYMVSAITLGIQDSGNPYTLSMVLCFLTFLALVGDTPRHIALAGKFTAGTVFLLTFFLMWGLWLEHPAVNRIIHFLSLGVAVFLLTIGYLLFQHWRLDKTQSAKQWLPLFLREGRPAGSLREETAEKKVGIIFFSVILGVATVLIVSLWPRNQNIYIFYYLLSTRRNVLLATLFFVLYSLAFTLLLAAVWGMIFYLRRCAKLRNDLLSVISWVRISGSAIFIAVGMGLIYLFIAT
ncbi:MAG: hypothetical protein HY210_03720 [Candidatus Omnitrophica bacterium]|nr:hypothetical protein [Candidatus Omnitrophota bacterium]